MERGRGGRGPQKGGRFSNYRRTSGKFQRSNDQNKIELNAPNASTGSLSNFNEWREYIYSQAKNVTKYYHRLIITNEEPDVYNSMSFDIILECYRAMNAVDQQRLVEYGLVNDDIINDLPVINNANEIKAIRQMWLEAKMDIYKDLQKDRPLIFNLIASNLSHKSEELVKGELGVDYDNVRANSDVMSIWNAILNTHNNGEELSPTDRNTLRMKYVNIHMFPNEPLDAFNKRYTVIEGNMARVDRNFDVNSIDNMINYVNALDNKRYADFKSMFFNDVNKSPEKRLNVPETRSKLYLDLCHYVTPNKFINHNLDKNKSAYKIEESKKGKEESKDKDDNTKTSSESSNNSSKPKFNKKNDANSYNSNQSNSFRGCWTCGSKEHNSRNCTLTKDEANRIIQEYLSNNNESKETKQIEMFCGSIGKYDENHSIALDTMSQVHIFNSDCPYLENVTKIKDGIILKGIGNSNVHVNMSGTFKNISVYVSPHINTNILSFSKLKCDNKIKYDPIKDHFIVTLDNDILVFSEYNDLYKCYDVNIINQVDSFNKRDLDKVEIIKKLYNKLAFPSDKTVEDIIKNKSIIGLDVDLNDFKNYKKLYPNRFESIRGKSTKVGNSYIPITDEMRCKMIKDRVVDLALDIFYLHGYVFIIVVNLAFDLANVRVLKNRSSAEIHAALTEFINIYKAYNWGIRKIYTDQEKGVLANKDILLEVGILLEQVAPGTHVSVAERKIRVIKERCRSIVASIKYSLPLRLIPWLVLFCTVRINQCQTIHTMGSSPRKIFTNDDVYYYLDIPLEFGEIVEVVNPVQDNTMKPRTQLAYYLCPVNNSSKDQFFMTKDGEIVIRSKWFAISNTKDLDIEIKCDNWIDIDILNQDDNLSQSDNDTDANDKNACDNMEDLNVMSEVVPEDHISGNSEFKPIFEEGKYFKTIDDNFITNNNIGNNDDDDESTDSDNNEVREDVIPTVNMDNNSHKYWSEVYKIVYDDNNTIYPNSCNDAIIKELQNMINKKVWIPTSKDCKYRAIPCKMLIKVKRNALGEMTKTKARIAAGGHMQRDIDESKSFSPTSSINTIMMLCTIHAKRNSRFSVIDITAAYLNAQLEKPIYMSIDKDIVDYMKKVNMVDDSHIRDNGSVIVELKKALYGTKEAGRLWYNHLDKDIKKMGYESNPAELGIYTKNLNGKICNILIYVDDIIVMSDDEDEHRNVIKNFKNFYNEINVSTQYDLEFEYLGLNFKVINKSLRVNMIGYINKILEERQEMGMSENPYTKQLFNNRKIELLDDYEQARTRSDVAKLLYLAKRARPDILLPTIVISSRASKYNSDDKAKLDKIYKYLNTTKHLELNLSDSNVSNNLTLYAYVDASHGNYDDGKGQSAYGFTLGSGLFLVKSRKQKTVSKSSTGSEILAIDDCACESIHLMNILNGCGFTCNKCILFEDNVSAINILKGGIEVMQKTKYMRIRVAHIKEMIEIGNIEFKHCSTDQMVVDILTKPILGNQFKALRDVMLGSE